MIFTPGVVRLGGLRLSGFGLCSAVGLLAALWLSQRTAKLAGLAAERVWNAGLFAVMAAFVMSRGLLVVRDPRAFLMYPLLVLGLPSFTYLGMALTAVAVLGFLRSKRLPLLDMLDAWAPCAAVLAAALSVGHFVEGTDLGMPTTLPWGQVLPGSGGLVRLQPVQVYATLGSLALFAMLLWMLERRGRPGMVAGTGLVVGGALAFGLDMLTQPVLGEGGWLEIGQWIALGAIVIGVVMVWVGPCAKGEIGGTQGQEPIQGSLHYGAKSAPPVERTDYIGDSGSADPPLREG